ncbi:hypothetical protein ABMA57_00015 [Saccharospirillum sp. HFRX-1]|uniref:hypothetical protein n=1 Tax=unclassified Saccharospirillum TaxID=2633430 RepID=UPI00371151FB
MRINNKIQVLCKAVLIGLMTVLCASCETRPYSDDTYRIGGFISGELAAEGLKIVSQSGEVVDVIGRQFSFKKELREGDSYSVDVAEQPGVQICKIQNGTGVVLGKNIDDIEVRCRSWRTEQAIFQKVASKTTKMVVDKDDQRHAIAVWQQVSDTSDDSDIWANLYKEDSGTWFEIKQLNGEVSGPSTNPQLSSQGDRDLYVVWEEEDAGSDSKILFVRHNQDVTQPPQIVKTGDVSEPKVASNDQGDVIVLWLQADAETGNNQVFYAIADRDSGWGFSNGEIVNDGLGDASDVQVAMNHNGDAVAVWLEADENNVNQVRGKFYDSEKKAWFGNGNNEAFLINFKSDEADKAAFSPELTIDGNGNVVVAWVQQGVDKASNSVWINTYSPSTNANGWGNAVEVDVENAGNVVSDSIKLMAYKSTQVMIVWSQDDGFGTNRVWAITHKPNGQWRGVALSNLPSETGVESGEQPQIAQDGDGNVIVVWRQSIAGNKTIWTSTYTPTSGWGMPEQIEADGAGDSTEPLIAMGQSGHAMAIWRKEVSGDLFSNLFE